MPEATETTLRTGGEEEAADPTDGADKGSAGLKRDLQGQSSSLDQEKMATAQAQRCPRASGEGDREGPPSEHGRPESIGSVPEASGLPLQLLPGMLGTMGGSSSGSGRSSSNSGMGSPPPSSAASAQSDFIKRGAEADLRLTPHTLSPLPINGSTENNNSIAASARVPLAPGGTAGGQQQRRDSTSTTSSDLNLHHHHLMAGGDPLKSASPTVTTASATSTTSGSDPDDKRMNNNTASYTCGGRLKFFKGRPKKFIQGLFQIFCCFEWK